MIPVSTDQSSKFQPPVLSLMIEVSWKMIPTINPVNEWLVAPIYKPFRRPFGRGTTRSLGDLITMEINHLLTGMILQVGSMYEIFPYMNGWF